MNNNKCVICKKKVDFYQRRYCSECKILIAKNYRRNFTRKCLGCHKPLQNDTEPIETHLICCLNEECWKIVKRIYYTYNNRGHKSDYKYKRYLGLTDEQQKLELVEFSMEYLKGLKVDKQGRVIDDD